MSVVYHLQKNGFRELLISITTGRHPPRRPLTSTSNDSLMKLNQVNGWPVPGTVNENTRMVQSVY